MNDAIKALAVLAVGAAALGLALRRTRPEAMFTYDSYPDLIRDTYVLELGGPEGTVVVESKLPFFGFEWGQFEPIEDDDLG